MSLRVITPPTIEPVTPAEVKLWSRIDGSGDVATDAANDALLASLISSARVEAENLMRRSILSQTLELTLRRFPHCGKRVELPNPPFVSVTSVTYFDAANIATVMDAGAYHVVDASDSIPPTVIPTPGTFWPDTYRRPDAVAIRYAAGWPDAASVPENIKTWIKLRVGTLYANREAFLADSRAAAVALPGRFFDGLLDRYRIMGVA